MKKLLIIAALVLLAAVIIVGGLSPDAPTSAKQEQVKRKLAGEMVSIPGGTFQMGDLSGYGDEKPLHRVTVFFVPPNIAKPVHSVTIQPFKIGKHEVTFAQWDACVADGGCGGYQPDDEGWGRGNRPVIRVSWDDAQLFIYWLNGKTGGHFRLPTEAEWEYAARAGTTTEYSWGDDVGSNRANCDGCGSQWDDEKTAPVGSFAANGWGLHDMHGNVWEWVEDCWHRNYLRAPKDGSARMSGNCGQRVRRGGSWSNAPGFLRSANRYLNTRSFRFFHQGFRLAQDE